MSRRPIVSYSGDCSLFCGLQASIVTALPEETVEWRRSYGRQPRYVNIEVDFVPFSEECLTRDPSRSVLQQPVFHTYWTDCTDVESYKSSVRESVQSWVTELRQHGITDWMVVVVGAPDTKKSNKLLPRTTVLDKMKADFGGKQAERCVSLYEPVKTDSRSLESWQALLAKMRSLIMVAYNRALNRFEEMMRSERERRTEKTWSFCDYFSVQEELAEVMRRLGVMDEALVQYDELDALLTQFVLNSAAGDTPMWLSNFKRPCERWEGLYLSTSSTTDTHKAAQEKIANKTISLLELRNYLFQQQSSLLLKLSKPWELAGRALSFLQNTVNELHILQINVTEEGGLACWGFLSCLEVIHTLARFNQPNTTHAHARHTAPLWAYARDKLQELGKLCGLLPGSSSSSESSGLQTVIALVCGMGNDPHSEDNARNTDTSNSDPLNFSINRKVGIAGRGVTLSETLMAGNVTGADAASFGVAMLEQDNLTPMTRLKDALSSRDAFRKHYLEISEVAISTYKHIGHVRSARLKARDLANFYLSLGQPQQAANFLSDLLNSFTDNCWPLLTSDTRHKLQTCYTAMQDWSKLLKVSTELACCTVLPEDRRIGAFNEMRTAAKKMQSEETLKMAAEEVIKMVQLNLTTPTPITTGSTLQATATLHSYLPLPYRLESIEVLLKLQSVDETQQQNTSVQAAGTPSSGQQQRKRSAAADSKLERKTSTVSGAQHYGKMQHHMPGVNRSNSSSSGDGSVSRSVPTIDEVETVDDLTYLQMGIHLDYKQDNTLASAAVICHNTHSALSRRDSHGRLSSVATDLQIPQQGPGDLRLTARDVEIVPGDNTVTLTASVEQKGVYHSSAVILSAAHLVLVQQRVTDSSGARCVPVEVIQQAPRLLLGRKGRDLIAGITQPMILTVHSGTTQISKDTAVVLRSSRGLLLSPVVYLISDDTTRTRLPSTGMSQTRSMEDILAGEAEPPLPPPPSSTQTDDGEEGLDEEVTKDSSMLRELQLMLPHVKPLSSVTLELSVLAMLGPQRDTNAVDHIVSLSSPSLHLSRQDVDVHFTPPFCSSSKLHTANLQKFFQVKVNGLVGENIELRSASLKLQQPSSPPSVLKSIKLVNSEDQTMVVYNEQSCSYMWELEVDYSLGGTPPLKLEFGVEYWTPNASTHSIRTYRCTFDLNDYKTVLTIKSRVEPSKGSEFCRAGTMCHLLITVETIGELPRQLSVQDQSESPTSGPARKPSGGGCGDNYNSIMYEVLADQTMWAVCGRTSGVLPLESSKRRQHVTLDVMPLTGGFLPLPSVRLSKYIPADVKRPDSVVVGTASSIPRLEPFSPGQVYNFSKGTQVHVLTAASSGGENSFH